VYVLHGEGVGVGKETEKIREKGCRGCKEVYIFKFNKKYITLEFGY